MTTTAQSAIRVPPTPAIGDTRYASAFRGRAVSPDGLTSSRSQCLPRLLPASPPAHDSAATDGAIQPSRLPSRGIAPHRPDADADNMAVHISGIDPCSWSGDSRTGRSMKPFRPMELDDCTEGGM